MDYYTRWMYLALCAGFCLLASGQVLQESRQKYAQVNALDNDKLNWQPELAGKYCVPDVLQGEVRDVIGSDVKGKGFLTELLQLLAWDFKKRNTVAIREIIQTAPAETRLKVVIQIDKKIMYIANEQNHTCSKAPLPKESVVRCLPKNATLLRKDVLGGLLKTEVYQVLANNIQLNSIANLTVTRLAGNRFLPVFETAVGSYISQPATFMLVMQYANLQQTISDPKIFDIPDYCQKDSQYPGEPSRLMKYLLHKLIKHN